MNQSNSIHESVTRAKSIGSKAYESLVGVQRGRVFGQTSQGIFIKTTSKWLNFLSFESYRGPLTINLPPNDGLIQMIVAGMGINISPGNFFVPNTGLWISLEEAEIWEPEAPASDLVSKEIRQARLVSLANRIIDAKYNSGLVPLLPHLLQIDDPGRSINNGPPALHDEILQLGQQMIFTNNLPVAASAERLLGSGSGLTPSGDDFILGMLLVFNRWQSLYLKLSKLDQFNSHLVEAAYQKTTTLSGNLIECSSLGLGNERLIQTLDWIVSGKDEEMDLVDNLLSWGSSSGVDAFVGYVIALSIA